MRMESGQVGIAELFKCYKGKKIALYGLSVETEKVLKELGCGFGILGLLDGFREEGRMYGYPIISLEYAVKNGVEVIVIVARPGSCRAIARRIGDTCKKRKIELVDIRGRKMLGATKVAYDFSDVPGMTRKELKGKIDTADIISFDLFDTLVMRQTLFSDDVAEYVEGRLHEDGIAIPDFCRRRIASEKELSKDGAPSLKEIYGHMILETSHVTAEQLSDLEWKTDFSLLIPRRDVCEIFKKAVSDGKHVYIVSDSYYSKQQLQQLLEKCGITGYKDILSSSDYGISKTQGLYKMLKEQAGSRKVLHIGDDIISDIESAEKYGFETCRLYSGTDLMELLGNMGLSEYMDSLAGRLKIGMFISRIFNSPFQFENDDNHIRLSDVYDIGFLFCAPMISDFVLWFYGQIRQRKFRNIWFSARDGYLIKKMYAELVRQKGKIDESIYFLTSRTAAIRAGIQNESGILYVDAMNFSGSLEQNLKERFGIDANEICSEDITDNDSGLLKYKKPIMEKAKTAYKNYKKYVKRLHVKEGDIAFFDFVARGTSQMYIQKLVDHQLEGFYFLQLDADYMMDKGVNIQSFYQNAQSGLHAVYDNYYILETLLTAPHPSVQGFDEYGHPVYAPETRRKRDISCFQRAQEGILDYFRIYTTLCPETKRTINKELDEAFLKLIHEIKITNTDFLNLVIEDPFFNRMTNITDVL